MTKGELVNAIAASVGLSKKVAGDTLEATLNAITKSLKNREDVTITGFGTFSAKERAARTGVNPRNPSEKIKIPKSINARFKAGKTLRDSVR